MVSLSTLEDEGGGMNAKHKQSYHHGNLREQLMDVAVVHLRKHGTEKLSLRAIARDLGVSQTAPYRHFKDKDALLAALATDGFQLLTQEMNEALAATSDDAISALQACGTAYINFARQNPEKYRLMFGRHNIDTSAYPELVSSGQASFNVLQDVIQRGINDGSFKDQPAPLVVNSAWAIVHGLATLILDRLEDKMPESAIEAQIEFSTRVLIEKI